MLLVPIRGEVPLTDPNGWRTYDLLEDEPGLFIAFSRIEKTPEAIKNFACRYGLLRFDYVDLLSLWQATIGRMDQLLYVPTARAELRDIMSSVGRKVSTAPLDDLLSATYATVKMQFGVSVSFRPNGSASVDLVASDFLSGLWLQAASALKDQRQFRDCAWEPCSRPIPVSAERPGKGRRGRSDKLFCSDSCRVKAYLKRRETAARLRAEGMKLRSIAAEVGTDLGTLKKWLGEK